MLRAQLVRSKNSSVFNSALDGLETAENIGKKKLFVDQGKGSVDPACSGDWRFERQEASFLANSR